MTDDANSKAAGNAAPGRPGKALEGVKVVELGQLDPETIVTPGIFVHQVVLIDRVVTQAGGIKA